MVELIIRVEKKKAAPSCPKRPRSCVLIQVVLHWCFGFTYYLLHLLHIGTRTTSSWCIYQL